MEIALPPTATRPLLVFDDQSGRDQVAVLSQSDWSAFEQPLPAMLHACVQHFPGLVIDAGANTGYYALLAALSKTGLRVVAFEPDPAVLNYLHSNIGLNGLQHAIQVSNLALSDRPGQAQLYVPTQEHGLIETSSSLEATFKPAHSQVHTIATTTLDAFLGRWAIWFTRVGIMKVDVEGHEAAVLAGAQQTIRRWRPIIFIEVLPGAKLAALSTFVSTMSYVDFPLQGGNLVARQEVEHVPEAWNHAFVPAEKVKRFRQAVGQ